jgi:hypothetical protein
MALSVYQEIATKGSRQLQYISLLPPNLTIIGDYEELHRERFIYPQCG